MNLRLYATQELRCDSMDTRREMSWPKHVHKTAATLERATRCMRDKQRHCEDNETGSRDTTMSWEINNLKLHVELEGAWESRSKHSYAKSTGEHIDGEGDLVYAGGGSMMGAMTTMSPFLELRSTRYADIPVVPSGKVRGSSPLSTERVEIPIESSAATSPGFVIGQSSVSQRPDSTDRRRKWTVDASNAACRPKRVTPKGFTTKARTRRYCARASAVKPNMTKNNNAHAIGVQILKLISDTAVAFWRHAMAAMLSTRPKFEWRSAKPR